MVGLRRVVAGKVAGRSYVARIPSYVKGSWAQSRACFDPPETFERHGGPPLLLVPGLFCTPSVFNRLGKALERRGADVFLPPRAYPIPFGMLANICRLETAASLLAQDLAALRWREGVERLTIVAHSNGVLISLLALSQPEAAPGPLPEVQGVIALACPFHGAPVAALLGPIVPACDDIRPGSPILARVQEHAALVRTVLISGFDAIVPEESQRVPGAPSVFMEGFQHMDFLVGTEEKIGHTAERILEALEPTEGASGTWTQAMGDSIC